MANPNPPSAAGANTDSNMESPGTWVDIGAASPLFAYEPQRNAPSGWSQDTNGGSSCSGGGSYAVGMNGLYFTEVTFTWTASPDYLVSVGIDGQLQSGPASSGGVTLNAQAGAHAIRLEASPSNSSAFRTGTAPTMRTASTFQFHGVKINTAVSPSGAGTNVTIDDVDSQVVYSGFSSTPANQSPIPAIQSGAFYQNTISYTSSAQASASLTFAGSAIYIFGPTGPSFGVFQVSIDSKVLGTYNASTTVATYDTLLFFTTQLDPSTKHQIVVTNQVEGSTLAIDYFVAVNAGAATASPNGVWPGEKAVHGENSSGVLVGGLLGGLLAFLLLFLAFMYWRWKKAGGTGSFWTAFCGPLKKALKIEKEEDSQFRAWPMLHYQPKYAVDN